MSHTRRQALAILGAATVATRTARAADPAAQPFRSLDHVEYFVNDIKASVAFYVRIFGNGVWKNNRTERRYLKLGTAYIAFEQGNDIHVDHFCAGVDPWDIAAAHKILAQRGVEYKDYPSGKDLYVADPDGLRLQMSNDKSWAQLSTQTASAESVPSPGEPIFQPTGLDHILLNVSNQEKSAAFYEKYLGPVTQRNNNRIWFQLGSARLGLLQAPAGTKPMVNHFCVSAAPYNYDAVTAKLTAMGAKVETPELAGAAQFRDPSGYLVQVNSPRV